MQFYNLEDASMRLSGSVIKVEGEFYLVEEVRYGYVSEDEDGNLEIDEEGGLEIPICFVSPVDGGPLKILNLDAIDIEPFKTPLGYVNLDQDGDSQDAFYFQRYPNQQTRIGLTQRNSGWYNGEGPSLISGGVWRNEGFIRMLKNEYPTFKEVMDNPSLRQMKVAISRDFAIEPVTLRSSVLLYKEERVGEVSEDSILLYPNGFYLKECLINHMEVGVSVEVFEEEYY